MDEVINPIFTTAPAASLYSFFQLVGSSPAAEGQKDDGLTTWCTKIGHPWFNGVLASRPPGEDETDNIRSMVAYFADRQVEVFSFWVEDAEMFGSWSKHLLPAGFEISQGPPGMSANLAELPEGIPMPEGFRIETVRDPEQLKSWIKVFVPGYGLPDHFVDSFYSVMNALGMDLPMRSYLGFLNDEPVSTCTLYTGNGTAGIYNVATLERARGQGLGTAITLQPLLEARAMGYTIGALQSSEMGFKVYQRLGFQKVGNIAHFYYSPA